MRKQQWLSLLFFIISLLSYASTQCTTTLTTQSQPIFVEFNDDILAFQLTTSISPNDVVLFEPTASNTLQIFSTLYNSSSTSSKFNLSPPTFLNRTLKSSLSLSKSTHDPCSPYSITIVKIPSSIFARCHNSKCFGSSSSFLDVCYHLRHSPPSSLDISLLSSLFQYLRTDFSWDTTEPKPAQYNFSYYLSALNATKSPKTNLRWKFILDYFNPYYTHSTWPNYTSPNTQFARDGMTNWTLAAMKQFFNSNIIWELYNEPNWGFWKPEPDVVAYGLLADQIGGAVKRFYPNETLVGPAAANVPFVWEYIETLLSNFNLLETFDMVTIHPYRQNNPETVGADYVVAKRLIEKYNPTWKVYPTPMYAGEWGYTLVWLSRPKLTPAQVQAKYFLRQYLIDVVHEIPRTFYYDFIDDGNDKTYTEDNFGIIYTNYTTKLAYRAGEFLASNIFKHARYNKQIIVDKYLGLEVNSQMNYVLIFDVVKTEMENNDNNINEFYNISNSDRDLIFVVWTASESIQTIDIPFGVGDKGEDQVVRIKSMYNEENQIKTKNGILTMNISGDPCYIYPGNSKTEFLKILSMTPRLPITIYTTPGIELTIDVPFINPTNRVLTVTLNQTGETKTVGREEGVVFKVKVESNWMDFRRYYLRFYIREFNFDFIFQTYVSRSIKNDLYPIAPLSRTSLFVNYTSIHTPNTVFISTSHSNASAIIHSSFKTQNLFTSLTVPTSSNSITTNYNLNYTIKNESNSIIQSSSTSIQVFDNDELFLYYYASYHGSAKSNGLLTSGIHSKLEPFSSDVQFLTFTYSAEQGYKYFMLSRSNGVAVKSSEGVRGYGMWVRYEGENGGKKGVFSVRMEIEDRSGERFGARGVEVGEEWRVMVWGFEEAQSFGGGYGNGEIEYPVRYVGLVSDVTEEAVKGVKLHFTSPWAIYN
eukprot:TRINITY_DN2168_c0_g1_i1.p1 TRINITY_DN2168_c0_g1~~TRINITY_DN2168_c0_g1_i1.p1  ORF type:complete len:927 (-),score=224.72 TRINITY_DN2168_c0_g1_i1:23-2803(-)